jgi:ABC-type polysaccharide/polyol phosphate export permease
MGPLKRLYRFRALVWYLAQRDLKVRYRRSSIGLLWSMLQPLLMMIVFLAVFGAAFRVNLPGYPVYALSGVLLWNFFQQSVVSSMHTLRGNASILQKMPLPREVFPIAIVVSGLVNLAIALVPLMAILAATRHPIRPSILFLPVSAAIAAAFTLGLGLLLSPLAIFFTDVVEIVGVLLTVLLYLTPIFYPAAIVPARFRWMLRWNPVRLILDTFRQPIWAGVVPGAASVAAAAAVAAAVLAAGWAAFRRMSDRIPFYL